MIVHISVLALVAIAFATATPIPETGDGTSTVHRSQDGSGNYAFSYDQRHGRGGSFHKESGTAGMKIGSYGLTESDGRQRVVHYIADENGFRATVESNEPGVVSKDSADVVVKTPEVAAVEVHPVAVPDLPAEAPTEDLIVAASEPVATIVRAPSARSEEVQQPMQEFKHHDHEEPCEHSEQAKIPTEPTSLKTGKQVSEDAAPQVVEAAQVIPDKPQTAAPSPSPPQPAEAPLSQIISSGYHINHGRPQLLSSQSSYHIKHQLHAIPYVPIPISMADHIPVTASVKSPVYVPHPMRHPMLYSPYYGYHPGLFYSRYNMY